MIECEHKVNESNIEPDDDRYIQIFHKPCLLVHCKHCNCSGVIVSHDGTFWEDEDGYLMT
jgi:hypothetical protein